MQRWRKAWKYGSLARASASSFSWASVTTRRGSPMTRFTTKQLTRTMSSRMPAYRFGSGGASSTTRVSSGRLVLVTCSRGWTVRSVTASSLQKRSTDSSGSFGVP